MTDHQYRTIYNRLLEPANLEFELLEIEDFADFAKYNIPAMLSVSLQVLRWLVPAPEEAAR